jgi:hypothetical protein
MSKIIKSAKIYEKTPQALKTINGNSVSGTGNIVIAAPPIQYYATDATSAITAATSANVVYVPSNRTITDIFIALKTAQASGSIFTVDIQKNGVSILGTLLTIDNTHVTSLTATTPAVISTTALAKGDILTTIVTQIGNGSAVQLQVIINNNWA